MTPARRASRGTGAGPLAALLLLAAAASSGVGCAGPPRTRTTFLNSVDLVEMTDRMAQSFVVHPAVSGRDASSPRWIVSMYRVVNHTNQIIPEGEKWLYVGRLRALLERSDVGETRSIAWIIPPERWATVAEAIGADREPAGLRLDPTHLLTARFDALTVTSGAGRSDTYLCGFELVDLGDGRIIWSDRYEVKHAAAGLTYD